MLARKRAALALLTAALLAVGGCDEQEGSGVNDPSGDFDQAPGEQAPEAEPTDEQGDD